MLRVRQPVTPRKYQILATTETVESRRTSSASTNVPRCTRFWIELRFRWSLLSFGCRTGLQILFFCLAVSTICFLGDVIVGGYQSPDKFVVEETSFAVIINTYKRPKQLQEAIAHYGSKCGKRSGVDHIYIVWAELDVTPPDPTTFFKSSKLRPSDTSNNSDLTFVRVLRDSLNSRFLPIEGLAWKAIFMVDDDVRVSCKSLQAGFDAWRARPQSMVGYYPRLSAPARIQNVGADIELTYYSWPNVYLRQQMNFILTKACFLHERYMAMYWNEQHPREILDYVDQYKNCEDVAMSILVANVTRAESKAHVPEIPIYVEGNIADTGLSNGISSGTGHMDRRSRCLNDITRIYRVHGWEPPLDYAFNLRESSWMQHWPGFWWQSRPSNVFEWLALKNLLK
ncbi:hypothetical protein FisN_1Lh186 [Fistulifera solaris]|uniref:Glycosyl transferase 64 domain-containing protein n=1 Tax=Fistulifera solaris TaxID=1519565 RepID=A0A1Z5K575_FISSO|nr:hypothetical protein FisN_1Lh186 [Fistulifera solaris]|eukprot:GAX21138.1 hypothetical protein FisN_1Lh186 [Fistulifera solaris]